MSEIDQEINGRKWVLGRGKSMYEVSQGQKEFYVFKGHIGERRICKYKGQVVPDEAAEVNRDSHPWLYSCC